MRDFKITVSGQLDPACEVEYKAYLCDNHRVSGSGRTPKEAIESLIFDIQKELDIHIFKLSGMAGGKLANVDVNFLDNLSVLQEFIKGDSSD